MVGLESGHVAGWPWLKCRVDIDIFMSNNRQDRCALSNGSINFPHVFLVLRPSVWLKR